MSTVRNYKDHAASGDAFRRLISVLALTIIVLLMVLIFRINSTAESSKEDSHCYTSIRIEQGDTLWSVAEEHAVYSDQQDYIRQIREVNGLKSDILIEDQYLIIPVEE